MVIATGSNSFSKEMTIRRKINSIFNKREEDFPSLKEYNDYLEEVEDMTFNLIEGIDVATIEAKIAQYKEENAEQIMVAQARKAEEYAAALAASKGPVQTDTDGAANQSLQGGFGVTAQGHYAPAIAAQPRPTQPAPLGGGSDMLGYCGDDEETMKLRAERAALAGGWSLEVSKKRALEEAFQSIWI